MSDFFIRKMKTYFRRFDFNNDGKIDHQDYRALAQGFAKHDEAKAKELEAHATKLFEKYTEGNPDLALTEDMFIASVTKQLSDPNYKRSFSEPLHVAFKSLDTNGNGTIELKELVQFFEAHGLDRSLAPATFEALDADKDGLITIDEFVTAGVSFFTSEDENCTSQIFWGPLI
jgi:Ca2+-binding EF-hand superfamily protein